MNSNEILSALKTNGLNFSIVADALGVSPQYVSRVASGKFHSYRVAAALAVAVDRSITDVFPNISEYKQPPVDPKLARRSKVAAVREAINRVA